MYDRERVLQLEELLNEKAPSEYLAEWGAYSDSNKYNCIFQAGEDLYPSLFVDDVKGVFYCHSCHRGGGTGKLIFYKMEQDFGIKTYYEALEKYLNQHEDIQRQLGFNTLVVASNKIKSFSLEDNILQMDNLLRNMGLIIEDHNLKLAPKSTEKNFTKIMEYCIDVQNSIELDD